MDLADTINQVQSSIVQICAVTQVLGTGFLVGEQGYIVTARHVTEGVPQGDLRAGFAGENTENMHANFTFLGLDLVEEDPRHDLTLMKLQRNPFVEAISQGIRIGDDVLVIPVSTSALDLERPRDGTAIAVSGYPLGNPVLVTNAGHLATAWGVNVQELPVAGAQPGFTMPDIADTYLADVQTNPGNSGGPVYRIDDGAVIGVCVAGQMTPVMTIKGRDTVPATLPDGRPLLHSADITVVVPARYVVTLLDRHGVNWH